MEFSSFITCATQPPEVTGGMDVNQLSALWQNYLITEIDTAVDPEDHMVNSERGTSDDERLRRYLWCGESAIPVIMSALLLSQKTEVRSVLDYACGGGRVARYLRALFPDTDLFFSDIDADRANFCANRFNGVSIPANASFDYPLGRSFDLIWVGSLFTHIDHTRMQKLFSFLWSSLNRDGLLIATFHGPSVLNINKKLISSDKWQRITDSLKENGVGYESYDRFEGDNIGVSVIDFARVYQLGTRHPNSRLVAYNEVGWAGLQDVGVWIKR